MLRRLRIENLVLIREAELELAAGINVVTGETGAGKTIFAQAIGLLLGGRSDAGVVGPESSEAYVEAELDLPDGVLDDPELESLRELRPEDEEGLVLSRRVFSDGRSRAYAWGRAVPREDVASVAERLIAMSGQFEQRRLARPAHQLDVLDAFVGEDQLRRRAAAASAWKELQAAGRRVAEIERSAADAEEKRAELELLREMTAGLDLETEAALGVRREVLRRVAELAEAASVAAEALAPELGDGEGATGLAARAAASLSPVRGLVPELDEVALKLEAADAELREASSALRRFLGGLEEDPRELDEIESELGRIAEAKRRFRCASYEELLAMAAAGRAELAALEQGVDPGLQAKRALEAAQSRYETLVSELRGARTAAAEPFAAAVKSELGALGLGDGELRVEYEERAPGPSGADTVRFLIRPNRGLPLAPVASTASGGELSRIALALRAVAHASAGEPTIVFDEIDAGIGGRTAHAVADSLRRLAGRAQVVVITHLPQLASVADLHLRVAKIPGDPTHTLIERLDDVERRAELERMLGGAEFLELVTDGMKPERARP